MNYNTFLIRFGIEPDNFKPIESIPIKTDTGYSYYLEQRTDINRICPNCNSKNVVIHQYDVVKLNITTNENVTDELIIKKVRFRCKKCNSTFTNEIEGVDRYSKITNYVKSDITNDFFKKYTFNQIARKYNISPGYVIQLFDKTFDFVPRGKLSKIVCIDEFHFSKYYDQNYCVVITDFESKKIIDVIKNRKKAYLEEYFSTYSWNELDKVEYFISDMYDEYKTIKSKFFPKAVHIIDMFHIISQLTNAINIVRNKVLKDKNLIEFNSPEYNFMKKNWKFFLCRTRKIPDKYYTYQKTGEVFNYADLVFKCIKKDSELSLAYITLQDMFKYKSGIYDMKIDEWIEYIAERLLNSSREEIKKVGATFIKWKNEISNAYLQDSRKQKLTNATAEGMNNKIKTIIKSANGFNNYDRFRKRILLIYRYESIEKGMQF